MQRTPPLQATIKQRPLDENLPQNSALRDYLAGKDETARHPRLRPATDRRKFGDGYPRIPHTLLVMPPRCVCEGAVKRVPAPDRAMRPTAEAAAALAR